MPHILEIRPYESVADEVFREDCILIIGQEDFIDLEFNSYHATYFIEGCFFGEKLKIENHNSIEFERIDIHFFGCFIRDIEISSISTNQISIHIGSSIAAGKIDSDRIEGITINNTIVNGSIFLINQKNVDISYTEENIFVSPWQRLLNYLGQDNFDTLLATEQSYHIHDSKKISFRSRQRSKDKSSGVYRTIYANDDQRYGYYLNDQEKLLLKLDINIDYTKNIENAEISIIDSSLRSVSLSGHLTGKINIENAKIASWFIHDFSIEKEGNFYNISPLQSGEGQSILSIHKCNLDNTWFDNIDFGRYDILSFYRTKFAKVTFTSCNFPSDYLSFEKFTALENVHYPTEKSDNYEKSQYEIFLQLKLALESVGNFYEAQKLQAVSNDALRKVKGISSWDRFILWTNSISNNHGLSIVRPAVFFFGLSIIFYLVYLFDLGMLFNSNAFDPDLIGYYFSFIDLTHRADFLVTKNEFTACSLLIDFLNKAFSGFFIYQFIAAFRKYGRR